MSDPTDLAGNLPPRGPAARWIANHVQEQRSESILAAFRREVSPERVFDFLLHDTASIRASAFIAMKPWFQDLAFCEAVRAKLLSSESELKEVILRALSGTEAVPRLRLEELFPTLLDDAAPRVRHETERLICYRYPVEAPLLMRMRPEECANRMLPFLCLSENPGILAELLNRLEYSGGTIPDAMGLLITPEWLGERPLEFAEPLMRQFGYIGAEGSCSATMHALLKAGFHFVNPLLEDTPVLHELREQMKAALDPSTPPELRLEARHNFQHLDPVEQAVFMSEARAFDRLNIITFKEQNPFNVKWGEDGKPAAYLLKSAQECETLLLQEGLERAAVMNIPKAHVGHFLLDWCSMTLKKPDSLQFREAVVFLSAKWHAVKALPEDFHEEILHDAAFPTVQDQDFPALKHVILGPTLQPRLWVSDTLSPGAASVARVAQYFEAHGVHDYLVETERALAGRVSPTGVELQMLYPREGFHLSLPWKQTLRYFGINSPRRPIFGAIVEASFRPAFTFHGPALGLALLFQCGLFPRQQESTIHISLQGDLGPDVRYILFLQEFLKEPHGKPVRPKDPKKRMAKLMSKGFVCRNAETEACGPGEPPPFRTEMRGFRIWVEPVPGGARVRLSFLDDLASVSLLGSALASKEAPLQKVWKNYAGAVEEFADSVSSPAVRELLFSNWYESTGDGDMDPSVLPILETRERAHAAIVKSKAGAEARRRAAAIRNEYATQVWQALGCPLPGRNGGTEILRVAGDVPLLVPPEIFKHIRDGFMYFQDEDNLLGRR